MMNNIGEMTFYAVLGMAVKLSGAVCVSLVALICDASSSNLAALPLPPV